MKKLLKGTLCLALLCALYLASASAATAAPTPIQSGNYWYILRPDNSAEITEYTGEEDALLLPSELDGHPVTGIGDYAFSVCRSLTSVTIPDSVTSIGDGAFAGCESLTSLTIPDSVTSIGNHAFFDCSSLTSVTIPDSVTGMGCNPFWCCDQLKTIQASPNHPYLAVIGEALFSKPDKRLICYLKSSTAASYDIPQGIRQICVGAFDGCSSLTSVTIPDSVTSIDDDAFDGCSGLTSVMIPDSVTNIGDWAFYYCSSLTSVTIPDSVTSIGDDAFSRCPDLTLTVPRGGYAAKYCEENRLRYTYSDALDWLNN